MTTYGDLRSIQKQDHTTYLLEDQRVQVTSPPSSGSYASTVISVIATVGFGGYAIYAKTRNQGSESVISAVAAACFALIGCVAFCATRKQRPHMRNVEQLTATDYVPYGSFRSELPPTPGDRLKLKEILTAIADGDVSGVREIPLDIQPLMKRIHDVVIRESDGAGASSSVRSKVEILLESMLTGLVREVQEMQSDLGIHVISDGELADPHTALPEKDLGSATILWQRLDLVLRRRDFLMRSMYHRRFSEGIAKSFDEIIHGLGTACHRVGIDLSSYEYRGSNRDPLHIQHNKIMWGLTQLSDKARQLVDQAGASRTKIEQLRKVAAEKEGLEQRVSELEDALRKQAAQMEALDRAKGKAKSELATSLARVEKLEGDLEEVTHRAEEAETAAQAKAEALVGVTAQLTKLAQQTHSKSSGHESELGELRASLERALKEKAETETALEELRSSTHESGSAQERAMAQLRVKAEAAAKEATTLAIDMESLKRKSRERIEELTHQVDELERAAKSASGDAEDATRRQRQLESELATAIRENRAIAKELRSAKASYEELSGQFDELNATYEALKKEYSAVRKESKAATRDAARKRAELQEISEMAAVAAGYIQRLGDSLMGRGDVEIDRRDIPHHDHVLAGVFDGIEGLKDRIEINNSRGYGSDTSSPFSSPGGRGHRRADSDGSSVGSVDASPFKDRGDKKDRY